MGRDTHYEGCWSDPKHQACAVAEIARLQKSVTYWREENERLRSELAKITKEYHDEHTCKTCW